MSAEFCSQCLILVYAILFYAFDKAITNTNLFFTKIKLYYPLTKVQE